jgi:predicted RNA-binding Zn-ribbon protein involved in translation (DUF1610 family)
MKIIENPHPLPTTEHICAKCQCKFEYTEQDVIKHHDSDANGRIGGTHYYSRQVSVACPNCGEPYILESKSGYTNSCIGCMDVDDDVASKIRELLGKED